MNSQLRKNLLFNTAGSLLFYLCQAALNLLERALYNDYMALDMASLTGGSLTNVAIRAAMANLNLKADRYEWQVRHFMQELLTLLHL